MANNNEKMTVVKTSLIALTKWGKEKKDNKRIDMGYFNDMLYFSVLKQNNEGKFKDVQSVYLKGISDTRMYLIAVEILDRLHRLYNGESIDSQELTIHNNKSVKEATTLVAFNAYKKDDRQIIYITIKKKSKTGEVEMDERFYFGQAHTIARYGDRKVTDTEVYEFFKQMELIFKAASGRSSDSRSKHLERYLSATKDNGGNNNYNNNNTNNNNNNYEKKENKGYHSNNSSNEDSDDFPF